MDANISPKSFEGYMCALDYYWEKGKRYSGNPIYADLEALRKYHPTATDLGIVRVRVQGIEVVEASDFTNAAGMALEDK